MAHTFTSLLSHVIFSTKDRLALLTPLTPDLRMDMLAYLGGIVRKLHGKVIQSNARPDHVHCLLSQQSSAHSLGASYSYYHIFGLQIGC